MKKLHTDILYSFYTPLWLCELMYQLAKKYGYKPNVHKVLEPSCGNGNMLVALENPTNCTAFELSKENLQQAKKRTPEVTFYNLHFETAFLKPPRYSFPMDKKKVSWLENYPFDLVIGNPPYGKHKNYYSNFFKGNFKQAEIFFIKKSLELLKENGLLVFIVPSSFLRNGDKYNPIKKTIKANLLDAYRMPKVFKNTSVPTDIIVLQKTAEQKQGNFSDLAIADKWFTKYPEKIAGKEYKTSSLFFPIQVRGTKEDVLKTIQLSLDIKKKRL